MRDKIYNSWSGMRSRCKHKHKKKGIVICKEWDSFEAFYVWAMLNGYEEGLTLDRIDNDDHYYPSNCRWVTTHIQNQNKRNCTLTEAKVRKLRLLVSKGAYTPKELAYVLDTSVDAIKGVLSGRTWTNIQ